MAGRRRTTRRSATKRSCRGSHKCVSWTFSRTGAGAHQLHFPSKGGKHRHTTTHHGITIDGVEEFVVRALHPAQRAFLRAPLTWSCVSQHGSIDPEPFSYVDAAAPTSGASGGASFSAQLAVLTSLDLNDTIVEAVGSLIPSDQREKATKYVVCGHCDAETVVV